VMPSTFTFRKVTVLIGNPFWSYYAT